VDEHGAVLDVLLQIHRDTEAAKSFFTRLMGEYAVPEVLHTDQLKSYGAAIRELPVLHRVEHQDVASTARCNNLVEQRAGVLMGVRSAQDRLTVPHDDRNEVSSDSGDRSGPRSS